MRRSHSRRAKMAAGQHPNFRRWKRSGRRNSAVRSEDDSDRSRRCFRRDQIPPFARNHSSRRSRLESNRAVPSFPNCRDSAPSRSYHCSVRSPNSRRNSHTLHPGAGHCFHRKLRRVAKRHKIRRSCRRSHRCRNSIVRNPRCLHCCRRIARCRRLHSRTRRSLALRRGSRRSVFRSFRRRHPTHILSRYAKVHRMHRLQTFARLPIAPSTAPPTNVRRRIHRCSYRHHLHQRNARRPTDPR